MRLPYRGFSYFYTSAQIKLLVQNQLMVDSSVSYWHPLLLAGLYISQRRISNLGGQGRLTEFMLWGWSDSSCQLKVNDAFWPGSRLLCAC